MPFDFKKEMKELYLPKKGTQIISVPKAQYAAISGKGDPNKPGGAYQQAVGKLYSVAYAVKNMCKNGEIKNSFDFVVPPLEGFWRQEGISGVDYSAKETFCWVSVIRMPDFVTEEDFEKAKTTAEKKKKIALSEVNLIEISEGLCAQIMHTGPFDEEPAAVAEMDGFLSKNGYETDIDDKRLHHEIYLSDPRKTPEEKRKAVIRHPIRKIQQ